MLVGTVRRETSNIIEETVSTYNIFKGRIFEEINKGTAWVYERLPCALFKEKKAIVRFAKSHALFSYNFEPYWAPKDVKRSSIIEEYFARVNTKVKKNYQHNYSTQALSSNSWQVASLRSWRYCVGARLKFWQRSRVPKKWSSDEAFEIPPARKPRYFE